MATYDDDSSFWSTAAALTPLGIGAGIGLHRAWSGIKGFPRAVFAPKPGSNVASMAAEMGIVARTGSEVNQSYINQIMDIADAMTIDYSGNAAGATLAAIDEAARGSFYRARNLTLPDIEKISRSIAAAPLTGTQLVPSAYEVAATAVAKYGDPRYFYDRMTGFLEGTFQPGVRLTDEELQAINPANIRGNVKKWLGLESWKTIPPEEQAVLQGWRKRWTDEFAPGEWTGDIKIAEAETLPGLGTMHMARFTLRHPELGKQEVQLNLPLTEGWHRGGKYMESLYATNKIISGQELISAAEHRFRTLNLGEEVPGSLANLLSRTRGVNKRIAKRYIQEFDSMMAESMVYMPAVRTPATELLAAQQQSIARIAGFKDLTSGAEQDAMQASLYNSGYFPTGTPATTAIGKVLTQDPRLLWPGGKLFPIERRPWQVVRALSPSAAATEAMGVSFGPGGVFHRGIPFLHTPAWRESLIAKGQLIPQTSVAYAVPGSAFEAALKSNVHLGQENLLINRDLMKMYESYGVREEVLAGTEYLGSGPMKDWVLKAIRNKGISLKPMALTPGERLGYSLRSGQEVLAKDISGLKEELIGAIPFSYAEGKQGIKLLMRQTTTPQWYTKLFGQLKVTTRARGARYMKATEEMLAQAMGVPYQPMGIDAFAYADELRKNRAFLRMQMHSGLAWQAADALEAGRISPKHAAEVRRLLAERAHSSTLSEVGALRLARRWGLDVAPIGGMVPHVYEGQALNDIMTAVAGPEAGSLLEQLKGAQYVVGLQTSAPGAYAHSGAFGIGATMEPRGFMQLLAKGEPYDLLAAEVARSMPGHGEELTELSKVLGSMGGKPLADLATINAGEINLKNRSVVEGQGILREKGYMLDLGQEVEALGGSKIYVPGAKQVRGMNLWRMTGGELRPQPLLSKYEDLVYAARHSGLGLEEAGREFHNSIVEAISVSMAGRSKGGPVGALRGRMAGSAFLPATAVDPMEEILGGAASSVEANAVELPSRMATEMFRDLERELTSAEDLAFIAKQKAAFEAGETIPIMMGRHGLIGPYSLQPVWARRAASLEAAENVMRVPSQAAMELTARAKNFEKSFSVDVSPLLGMAGDLDDDRYIVKLIGDRKVAGAMENLLKSGKAAESYQAFAAKAGLLTRLAKDRAAQGAADIIETSDVDRLIMGSAKMRRGVGMELGKLSTQLSEAKLAMLMHNPEAAPNFNIIAEIMEQQIIGSKHLRNIRGNLGEELATTLRTIHQEPTSRATFARITKDIFGPEAMEPAEVTLGGKALGKIEGINPEGLATQVADALGKFRNSPEHEAYRRLILGKSGDLSLQQAQRMLREARLGRQGPLVSLATREMATEEGLGAKMAAEAGQKFRTAVKEAGSVARSWGKPFLYGLAASAGLAMLLSGPKLRPLEQMPASPVPRPRPELGTLAAVSHMQGIAPASRDLRPERLQVPGQVRGEPGMPGMPSPVTYMTTSPGQNERRGYSYHVSAFSGSRGTPNHQAIAQSMQQLMPNARMHLEYNDNRQKMTSQRINDMLEGF